MLVHVTRFVDVQHKVCELIQEEIESIRLRLTMGEGMRGSPLRDEFRQVWLTDFAPTSQNIRELSPDENLPEVTWEQVDAELAEAATRIEVKEINGNAVDALNYVNHRQGLSIIAVGGDKLSRGLTLEGLSVSYFLRASQMYDTLMQMGRWFGYRPGYLDLCRLFTTEDLRNWYRHIALAELELRKEFDRMKTAGLTPRHYGLRVREHPGGLLITAMNKMSHSETRRLSYAGQLIQTSAFDTSPASVQKNWDTVERFLLKLNRTSPATRTRLAWIWKDVSPATLIDHLLSNYAVAPDAWRFQKPEVIQFLRQQALQEELTNWTVALVNTDGGIGTKEIAGLETGIAERSPEANTWQTGQIPPVYRPLNANIQSPAHQALDLANIIMTPDVYEHLIRKRSDVCGSLLFKDDESEILQQCMNRRASLLQAAELITQYRRPEDSEKPSRSKVSGDVVRQLRPSTHGLLLIYLLVPSQKRWPADQPTFAGLAMSFPSSHTARAVEYRVNRVWQETFQDDDYVDRD